MIRLRWAVAVLGASACSQTGAGKTISVAGTYQTTVAVVEKTCTDMGIEQHPTTVTQQPGDTLVTITHASASYRGKLNPDGRFSTTPSTFTINNVSYIIRLTGQFTLHAVEIRAQVDAGRQPPCRIIASWNGPKDGPPNRLP